MRRMRLPKFPIGEGKLKQEFTIGSIESLVEAAEWFRKLHFREHQATVIGIPTAWIDCATRVGLFSNPKRNDLLKAFVRGTSRRKAPPPKGFDLRKALAKAGLADFWEPMRRKDFATGVAELDYDRSEGHAPINMRQMRMLFSTKVGIVEDGVIHYMHVRDKISGINFLWGKFTKHRHGLPKKWGNYSKVINELHELHYGKRKRASHLDVIAVHPDDDFANNPTKAVNAIKNAYREEYVMDKLYPMLEGTDARVVVMKRGEYPPALPLPTEVEPLFPEGKRGLESIFKKKKWK